MGREVTKGEGSGVEEVGPLPYEQKQKVGTYAVSGPTLCVNFRENFRRGRPLHLRTLYVLNEDDEQIWRRYNSVS